MTLDPDPVGPPPRTSSPTVNEAAHWVELILPKFAGKLSGYALNVPVQRGSLLDFFTVRLLSVNCFPKHSAESPFSAGKI
jgi:Glyceraldehyde 3-phosphate dehydrogenase, C-terminal domain